ncbi:MAG: glutathione S-transferase family protein [Planctomycetes bacterium]|nr:glutathione S-transferase family protein [Planctomycetota bacterium]
MSRLRLLTLPPSPHNTKVRLALNLKGLEYETVLVGFDDRSAVVAASGQPLTPVLLDGDRVIYDSFGIMRYLDANWAAPRLFREDRDGQRQIQDWERFAVHELGSALGLLLPQALGGPADEDAKARAQARFLELPARIEEALAGRDYLMGDRPNAADLTVAPFLRYAALESEAFPEGPARFMASNLDIGPAYPRTREWAGRVMALDQSPATA